MTSLLGANYTVVERWGTWLYLACVLSLGILLWRALRRGIGWKGRVLGLGLCVFPAAGLAATRFIASNIQPLVVPAQYQHREISFPGLGGRLGGEILLPPGSGPRPAAILLVGSDVSSYRTNYARLASEVLTPVLSSLGFVILYFDKRGVGRSEGDWAQASFGDRAEDARAALRFLAREATVDPKRLIVIGHSQGGWIAQMLGADPDPPALVISLAGPTVSVEEQMTDDEMSARVCRGAAESEAVAQARQLLSAVRVRSVGAKSGRYRQFALIADHRPDRALLGLKSPTLLLFGANDRMVPPEKNLARLHEIYEGELPPHVTAKVIPGAGHSFRLVERCHSGSQKSRPYSGLLSAEIREAVTRLSAAERP